MRLRVMTYNIRHGKGTDGWVSLARIRKTIAVEAPRLAALQEVDRVVPRSWFVPQATRLGRMLGLYHAFGANIRVGPMAYGNAVLSDRPLLEAVNHHLPSRRERRGLLVVRRADLVFACTHLGLDARERREQVSAITAILRPYAAGPLILAGDLNCRRGDPELEELHGLLSDTAPDDRPYTYPSEAPEVKADYVFISPHFRCRGLSAPASPASDHRPLCADLELVSVQEEEQPLVAAPRRRKGG